LTRWFRYVALAEALSFVCLLVATAVKYGLDEPGGVELLGPIHGLLFLAYFVMVAFVREERGWGLGRSLAVLAAAVVPLGGFFVEQRLLQDAPPAAPPPAAPADPTPVELEESRSARSEGAA